MAGITPLPTPPSLSDPANFDVRADAWDAALQVFSVELGALGTPGLGGGDMTADLGLAPEINVPSAATCNIGAAVSGSTSNKVAITGTTTITSFGTVPNRLKYGRFTGALTLTNNGTSLMLPGGTNIATAAGDTFIALSDASGNWRVVDYERADGAAIKHVKPTGGFVNLGAPAAATIAAGVITATRSAMTIDTEGGASTDDLTQILGGTSNDLLLLRSTAAGRVITLKDNANLRLSADIVLSDPDDTVLLLCAGSNVWLLVSPSNNS